MHRDSWVIVIVVVVFFFCWKFSIPNDLNSWLIGKLNRPRDKLIGEKNNYPFVSNDLNNG